MNKTTGGPAFPITQDNGSILGGAGMTLRDHFAGLAMQGFAADGDAVWANGVAGMACAAYKWADAMMEARK